MGKFLQVLTLLLALSLVLFTSCSQGENTEKEKDSKFKTISTKELKNNLSNDSWTVVDTRINDAYNGWKLDGVSREGHIKGAVDFSSNWLDVKVDKKEEKINEVLKNKNILQDKNIVLYDANEKDAEKVANYLSEKGYKNIFLYNVKEWCKDSSLPMEKYEDYKLLVPAVVLKDIVDGKKPETFEGAKNIKIVEASWGEGKESYSKGHIPTTVHINTDTIEPPTPTPPSWMLADDKTLEKFALDYGFNKDDTVIVTGEDTMASFRVSLVLRYIGINDVRVLNGGTAAWVSAGYELETKENAKVNATDFGGKIPMNPDVIDTIPELKEKLKDNNFQLVDNRSWKEYIGEESGYSYHDKKGRIKGAVFGYAGTKSTTLEDYRNLDNTMRNKEEILALWNKQKIDTNKHLSFMCGSGWRAAEVYTYAKVMGFNNISLYSDGWIGWSCDASNPVETGNPK